MADNSSLLHVGQVSERNVNNASARVAMDDFDGLVSGEMQVLFPAIGGWQIFFTPKEGDHVLMSRLPNGPAEGHVLGKVFTASRMPQGGAPDIILLVSDDGKNVVRFDAANGTMDMICDQGCSLKAKNLDIEVKETANIKTRDLTVEAENNVTIEAAADVRVKAGTSAVVDAPQVSITGGMLTVDGAAAPSGSGPFCALPTCLFTGAPHVGNMVSGT